MTTHNSMCPHLIGSLRLYRLTPGKYTVYIVTSLWTFEKAAHLLQLPLSLAEKLAALQGSSDALLALKAGQEMLSWWLSKNLWRGTMLNPALALRSKSSHWLGIIWSYIGLGRIVKLFRLDRSP